MSKWIPLAQVLEIIGLAERGDWSWCGNSRCKHIELRIDMRDRHCLVKDRDGNPASLEELRLQHGSQGGNKSCTPEAA
jgi:hypothetical protein